MAALTHPLLFSRLLCVHRMRSCHTRVRDKVIWTVSSDGAKDLRQGVEFVASPLPVFYRTDSALLYYTPLTPKRYLGLTCFALAALAFQLSRGTICRGKGCRPFHVQMAFVLCTGGVCSMHRCRLYKVIYLQLA